MTKKRAINLICLIFFASGISGLIYEVVWLRMLARIMGVTIYATSTVVAAFMAGLALGSFLFGRFIDRREDTLRVYSTLELLIGITALLVPVIFAISLPTYKYIYGISGENLLLITVLRTLICFLALLLPTTMMGGTLPILTSWLVKRGILFGRSFSILYGVNTLGAVFGVIISGFITLEFWGEYRTILLGVLLNFSAAIFAYAVYKKDIKIEEQLTVASISKTGLDQRISPYSNPVRRVVLLAFTISGFTALAYEVIWTRQLILFLRTSIYSFSGMLVVFLAGIALGSIFMRNIVDRFARPIMVFGVLELAVGLLSVITLFLFPVFGSYSLNKVADLLGVIAATFTIVFPLTFLFGMIFPTASVCYAKDISGTGSSVGWLYGSNTIGSILGALLAGFWLIPNRGSTNSVILLAFLNVSLGLLLLWQERRSSMLTKICYLAVIPILFLLVFQVKGKDPFLSTIELRIKASAKEKKQSYDIFFNKEGIEGTVTAFSINNHKGLWINAVGMTTLCTETKLMTHLPIMCSNKSPKEMLIICFGMGTVLKSAVLYQGLDITTVELVPEIYDIFGYYHKDGQEILRQKNVHAIVNDGRNHLLLSDRKYDIITIDPAPPVFSAGTVNLYAREFIQLCKKRLTSEGVMCLWIPSMAADNIKSVLKTFYSVFPKTRVFIGPNGWGLYLIGSMKQISDDDFNSNAREAFNNPVILKDLAEYNDSCVTFEKIHKMFLWENGEIEKITNDGSFITDDSPYTEFFLWRILLKGMPTPLKISTFSEVQEKPKTAGHESNELRF